MGTTLFTKSNIKLFDDVVELFTDNILIDCIMPWEISTIDNFEDSEFFKIERHDDFILFYTLTSPYGSRKYGACYSINSENPNDSSNRTVWQKSPYIKVKDNWYISRNLAPAIRLPLFNPDIPESSIIDHSMKTPDDSHVQSNRRPE